MDAVDVLLLLAGFAVGVLVMWIPMRGRAGAQHAASRVPQLEASLREYEVMVRSLREDRARTETMLEAEQVRLADERELMSRMQADLHDSFKALSARALQDNNQQFLDLARSVLDKHQEVARGELTKRQTAIEHLVRPMHESLKGVELQFAGLEKSRIESHASLLQQVRSLETTTGTLATALRAPKQRGRWGELQLRRVVELSGMVERCDFVEQTSTEGETGRLQPDMVVQLPAGKKIVIDAKTPMDAYLAAMEQDPGERRIELLQEHAARVRQHVTELTRKEYWRQFDSTPEFVVLFLPGEDLFSAALEQDPSLIEYGAEQSVMIATPTSLITILRSVAHGWREQALADNARSIRDLGRQLYDRAAVVAEKWGQLGKHLDRAVGSYNESVSSMESRFLVTARRLADLEVGSTRDVRVLEGVDSSTRPVTTLVAAVEDVDELDGSELLSDRAVPAAAASDRQ